MQGRVLRYLGEQGNDLGGTIASRRARKLRTVTQLNKLSLRQLSCRS